LLSRIQYLLEGAFQSSARIFNRAGLSPNSLTFVGFVFTLVSAAFYAARLSGWAWEGAILGLVVAGYLDAVDGAMARKYGRVSRVGGVLDSVLDRLGEIGLYSGLAIGGLVSVWVAIWALSAALMVSYVRARVSAEGVTLKGVGIAERPERLLTLLVATIFWSTIPVVLFWGIFLIALLSSVTVVERVYRARKVLGREEAGQSLLSS
jgi:archaetidylinositol phosphate synthase